jgi:hypothetical protein
MKIENHKCFSLTNRGKFEPEKIIKAQLEKVDATIRMFNRIKPDDLESYITHLISKFGEIIGNYDFESGAFNWELLRKDTKLLQNYPELEQLIFLYTCMVLEVPKDYESKLGEIELDFFDWIKVLRRIPYFLVKTIVDIHGKEKGIEIYKQTVPHYLDELISKNPPREHEDPEAITIIEFNERQTKAWCECGLGDFTVCTYDDYKIVYRFDSCLTPEALKEFNDPDIAYLSSCYVSDHPKFNEGRVIHLRRTQTLHHSEFCDELYWNNLVYPNTEHPPIDFIENMGKDKEV